MSGELKNNLSSGALEGAETKEQLEFSHGDDLNWLLDTNDAMKWAVEFCKLYGNDTLDEGLMVAWFACAMGAQERASDRYQEGYNDGQRDTAHALMGLDA